MLNTKYELDRITSMIKKIYLKYIDLELSNQSESLSYQKLIEIHSNIIELENEEYSKIIAHGDELEVLDEIINDKMSATSNYDFTVQDSINIESFRIINNFLSTECVLDRYKQFINPIENPSTSLIHKSLNNDINMIFLVILEDYLKELNSPKLKEKFIRIKYRTIFKMKNLENVIIKNNFNIKNSIYLDSLLGTSYVDVDTDKYEKIKENYLRKIVLYQVTKLLSVNDRSYNDEEILIKTFIRQFIIRSCFTLLSEEEIMKLTDECLNYIAKKENTGKMGTLLINHALCHIAHDKALTSDIIPNDKINKK